MRKLLGGAVAVGLATAGSLALATPGFAQEDPGEGLTHLAATIAPAEGGKFTVTSEDNCSEDASSLEWAVFHKGDFSWDDPESGGDGPVAFDIADLNEDGSWQVTVDPADFTAPDPEEDQFKALAEGDDPEDPGDEAPRFEVYGRLELTTGDQAFEWFGFCEVDHPQPPETDLTDKITSHPLDPDFGLYLVKPGDHVTAGPIDKCPEGERDSAEWDLERVTDVDTGESEPADGGTAVVADDGDWQVAFTAPATKGIYVLWVACLGSEGDFGLYNPLFLGNGVTGEPPKTPEPPTIAPPPATPVDEPPHTTG